MSLENRDEAIREAKIFVRQVVRNDWEFDSTLYADGKRPGPSTSSTLTDGTLCEGRQVVEWRCREFDSAGSELEPQSSDSDSDSQSPGRASGDPAIDRRRQRRRQIEDEMAWNEGLRMFMARRDAWSGARTQRQIRAKEQKRKLAAMQDQTNGSSDVKGVNAAEDGGAGIPPPTDARAHGETGDTSMLANKAESCLSITEKEKVEEQLRRQDQDEEQSTAPDEETKRKESTETCITEPDQTIGYTPRINTAEIDDKDSGEESDCEEEEELDEPLIPVAPPFISSANPVRATITPSIYPSIYTKVVVQGMTPTIPVNLADLTKAMVQGWKADGQWPPKPAVSSIVLQDDASVPKKAADSPADGAPQSRRKNSITNAMRKVFHMGAHPFHRRGSTSQDAGAGNGANGTAA
ncbi:uncharacterized protein N7473_002714 [Penicillium subrubescens]|uniref:Gag1-like clamp domain-containing protein n=1 Tax=Penicillium subrubescens TaxID=1316194 RepID=A0A1Q5UKW8_9EURO|nr:uncharacterized protein N7473_002714 [Penicillium subrubescens]KAJ5905798.1 hypothetical protein N7473_002714 [Penicillium subrubescens]OKP13117.1 hypothetical protein PENSUB_1217 [Penicillium subrubescens]